MKRRRFITSAVSSGLAAALIAREGGWSIASFETDVTIPMGHPCMGGGISPARKIADPLHARGFVLQGGGGKPLVIVSVEWCEIRNEAFESWRSKIAAAAGTDPGRVLVSATHAHDAPVMDYEAERLLREAKAAGSVCDPAFGEAALERVAADVRKAMLQARKITHFGTGRARVEGVASNRRFIRPDGAVSYARMSRSTDPVARGAEDGTIDPWLQTLSFWDGEQIIAALHAYSCHPMSYYGGGEVSADFPGVALALVKKTMPEVTHVFGNGCAGNVTAGKYNDGSPENRARLAERLYQGMSASLKATTRSPLTQAAFRCAKLNLEPRTSIGFSEEALKHRLVNAPKPFEQCLAAMGLSWRNRVARGLAIDVPVLDLGGARLILLPAESYVEFQLFAQEVSGPVPTLVLGYGECAPGYIPVERAWRERDSNLHDWCWVNPGSEERMRTAIRSVLA